MESSFAAVREARDMITEGALGPRMFVSGPTLDGVLPNFPGIPPGVLTKIKTPAPGRMRQLNLQLTRMAAQGGIRLLAGTDWPGTSYGKGDYRTADRSSHRELQGLV